MTCGEGLHRVMLGLNVVAIVVYVVLSPLTYLFVFFVLVPRHGLANPQLNRNYGFVWSRFEARCYWWEAIELVRKMGVVVVVATVKTAMPQSLLGIVLIGVVFCCSLLLRPFVREIYDAFDSLATATILIFMALGVLLHGNRGGLLSGNVNAREAEAYVTFCTTLAFVSFSVTCVFGVYAVADDLRRILMMRRTRRLRRKTGLALQTSILRLNINSVQLPNPAILEYVESVQDDTQALAELREIERLLQFATTDTQESRQMRDRTEFMERQLSVEPSLADWMLDDRVPNDELRNYMTMAIELRAQSRPKGKVSNVLSDVHDGSIALWLTQLSTSEERALFRKLVMAVDTQMKRPRGRWSKLTANLLMKGRLTASIRSRLHGLFRRSQQVLPAKTKCWSTMSNLDLSTLQLTSELEAKLEHLMELTQCETAVLVPVQSAVDPLTKLVVVRGREDMAARDLESHRQSVVAITDWELRGRTPAGVCMSSKAPVLVSNILSDRRFKQAFLRLTDGLLAISQLCVPVLDGADVVGVLKCLNKTSANLDKSGLPFDAVDEDYAADVALSIATLRANHTQSVRTARMHVRRLTEQWGETRTEASERCKPTCGSMEPSDVDSSEGGGKAPSSTGALREPSASA